MQKDGIIVINKETMAILEASTTIASFRFIAPVSETVNH